MSTIDNDTILEVTIDGENVQEITQDGDVVYSKEVEPEDPFWDYIGTGTTGADEHIQTSQDVSSCPTIAGTANILEDKRPAAEESFGYVIAITISYIDPDTFQTVECITRRYRREPQEGAVTYTYSNLSNGSGGNSIPTSELENIVNALNTGDVKELSFEGDYGKQKVIENYDTQAVQDYSGTAMYDWSIVSVNTPSYAKLQDNSVYENYIEFDNNKIILHGDEGSFHWTYGADPFEVIVIID